MNYISFMGSLKHVYSTLISCFDCQWPWDSTKRAIFSQEQCGEQWIFFFFAQLIPGSIVFDHPSFFCYLNKAKDGNKEAFVINVKFI